MFTNLYKSKVIENYSLIQYNNNDFRFIINKINLDKKEKKIYNNSSQKYNTNYLRTKRIIRELALCNNFRYFVTLTVSPLVSSRDNLDEIIVFLRKQLKKYKRKNHSFQYLLIAEKHKDKKNYHFHGLMKGVNDSDIYTNKNGYLSCFAFDDIGFNSFSKIKDYDKTCSYITKYISKDICKLKTGHSYFCSRGLIRPTKTYYKPISLDFLLKKTYENDYCKFYDFKLSDLDNKTKLILFDKFSKNYLE